MQAWMWWAFGLMCFGVETLSLGSFVFVFFGAGALVVGTTTLLGVTDSLLSQAFVCVAVASVSMVGLRRRLRRHLDEVPARAGGQERLDEMATAAEDIAPGALGQVELRGTVWRGLNAGTSALAMGQTYRVLKIDNLTVVLMDRGPAGELK